ncbi:MAG: transporter [Bacteroidota bacterium]
MKYTLKFCLTLILLFSCQLLSAQIFTDRPNQTDAIQLLPKGFFQVELGYMRNIERLEGSFDQFNLRTNTAPNVSIKYGLSDRVEVRVLFNYITLSSRIDGNTFRQDDGVSPITLSPKFFLFEQKGILPKTTFVANLTFPSVGSEQFQVQDLNYGFRFLMENATGKSSIAYGIGLDVADNGETAGAYSITYGYPITDKLGSFVEFFGFLPGEAQSTHTFDFGLTYLIIDSIQIDVSYGIGLNERSFDNFISTGIAWGINTRKN